MDVKKVVKQITTFWSHKVFKSFIFEFSGKKLILLSRNIVNEKQADLTSPLYL